jgi:agmatinase
LARTGERGDELLDHDVHYLSAGDVRCGSEPGLREFFAGLAGRPVHFSIDIDVLDPALAPGTRCLRAGGLAPADVVRVARAVAACGRIVSLDLMEVAPRRSEADLTPFIALELLLHVCDIACRQFPEQT